ncbi:MAG: HAD family phosphatase [Flexilinea sp.]|nr:HAD family phosphatase [Flexilinea sp.]
MNSKLIFLDIDGTLTSPGSNIPPESALEAIRQAQANGHKVFLCSGRNPAMLSPLLKYNFEGAVASAGGYIFAGDQILFDCPMEKEDFENAMRLFKENGVFRTIEARDGSWCDPGMGEFLSRQTGGNSELLRWRKALEADLGIRPMSEYDGRPIYKIVFMCESQSQLDPVREAIGEKFNVLIQETFSKNCLNGEIINRKYDKGRGVRIVAEALGYDIADTIGFGDSMNDLEMIETVGCSLCMENGSAALKAKSDIVCPAVDQDGLAWGFRHLGLC